MNKQSSRSSLFLIELVLSIFFFIVAAAICLQLFISTYFYSRETVETNQALLWSQNLAEPFLGSMGEYPVLKDIYADADCINKLSFSPEEHILLWLESCIEICQEYGDDVSFIQQYQILVKKLTSGEQMEDKVTELIKGSEELRKCIEIKQALPDIKGQLLYDFMDAINLELQNKGGEVLKEDYECAKIYYDGRAHIPICAFKIVDFNEKNKKITLALVIRVDYNLSFHFQYLDEDNNTISKENFKKKKINEKVANSIIQVLNIEIRSNSNESIAHEIIKNENN